MLPRRVHRIVLLLALLVGGVGMNYVQAAPMARAMWDANTKTLTFYYGEQKSGGTTHYSGTQITATGTSYPKWHTSDVYSNVTKVVFESSFANVRPASCLGWFYGMEKLTTITGINYLKTDNVNSMYCMFYGCSGLTSLNLSSFNTANVTNMAYMFYGCSGLTSLNLSSFNTAKVTNMNFMFKGCSNLQIIYVDESKWSTAAVTSSTDMFAGCYKLVGGNGTVFSSSYTNRTRACIDKPGQVGYLTDKCTIVWKNDNGTVLETDYNVSRGTTPTYNGATPTKTATAQYTYTFKAWSPTVVAVTKYQVYTATYNSTVRKYTIAVASNNSAMGYAQMTYVDPVSHATQVYANTSHAFNYGDKLTLSATPNTGYHFVQWNDGNKNATRSVTVTGNATYTATFAINTYTLMVNSNNTSYGTVSGGGTYNHGATATLTATTTTSNCTVDFLQWSDGVKDNPRTVTVTAAATYTAQFGTLSGNCGASGNNLTWSFNRCTGVLTISGSGAMADYTSSPQPWASYISYINSVVLPEGITSIGIRAFKNHTALSSINLPSTLTNIGLEAFRATALTSVEIPSGMQWINYWTFKDCASLTTVRLPASITSLPTPGAFCGCTSLQFVYVSWETASQIPTCSNTSNFFHDLTTKPTLYVPCGTISLYQNKGWNNKFTITDVLLSGTCGSNLTWSLNTCGVLTISGTGAMSNYPGMNMPWRSRRASITSVVISDGVTSIGYNAFNGCSNLTSVTIPPSVTSIEQNAFYGCYAMESLYITDLAAWCNVEFGVSVEATPFMRNNYNSGSTEYLGGGNLYLNGTLVTTLTIPDGITEIKNLTFLGCSSITSIDFNQVTTIGSASFKGCHGLTSVTLPEGVTSLQNAFPYCTQLQSISIPASLTSLARQTLYHSDALTDIYVYWTDNIPGWPEYFTSKSPQSSITLHVPCSAIDLYRATYWKNYTIEGEGGPYTITVRANDDGQGSVSIPTEP